MPVQRRLSSRSELFAAAVVCLILSAIVGSYSLFSYVDSDESVVRDCDGELTVWRAPEDSGFKWDGFCRTTTYDDTLQRDFREEVVIDGARVTLRGHYAVMFPREHPDTVRAFYRTYGSQDAVMKRKIVPAVRKDILAAAAEPGWHQPKGGIIKRELKNAFEYGLRRVSPTGDIWTSPEAKHALEDDIQHRLDVQSAFPDDVMINLELGFVTER